LHVPFIQQRAHPRRCAGKRPTAPGTHIRRLLHSEKRAGDTSLNARTQRSTPREKREKCALCGCGFHRCLRLRKTTNSRKRAMRWPHSATSAWKWTGGVTPVTVASSRVLPASANTFSAERLWLRAPAGASSARACGAPSLVRMKCPSATRHTRQ